jgi:tripartite-type tricarboxylate transporter receptor subunit TctC
MTTKRQLMSACALAACVAALPSLTLAQSNAKTPITIVVPYPPGGTADFLPRLVAEQLPSLLGVPVIVLNKPGAAGVIGSDYVARAPADGNTLLVVPPHFFVYDMLYKVQFDPRAFKSVSIIASYPNVLLGSPKLIGQSLSAFLATAKTAQPPLTGGSPGAGTSQHLSAEMLTSMAKIDYTHVPYKGSAPAMADLLGSHIDFMFDNLTTALPFIQSGKLALLGVGSTKRSKLFPNVPAIGEQVPGYQSVTWMGIVAPPGTPADVVAKLSKAIGQAVRSPAVSAQIEKLQADPVGSTEAEMNDTVKADTARWASVIKAANITPD